MPCGHGRQSNGSPNMSIERTSNDGSGRRTPAKGVVLSESMPLIVFCTVCAEHRGASWVSQASVMQAFHEIWEKEATAWLVGWYVLMPNHIHFLCVPLDAAAGIEVETWVTFWKSLLSRRLDDRSYRWQRGLFHHRMRHDVELAETMEYMRQNPVKKGLIQTPDEWPWKGQVHSIFKEQDA